MLGSGSKAGSVVGWGLLWDAEVDSDPGSWLLLQWFAGLHIPLSRRTKEEWPESWVWGRLGQLSPPHLTQYPVCGHQSYSSFCLRKTIGCDFKMAHSSDSCH